MLTFYEQAIAGHYNHWRKIRRIFLLVKRQEWPEDLMDELKKIRWETAPWPDIKERYHVLDKERLRRTYEDKT